MGAAPGAAPSGAARDPKATPQVEVSLLDPGQPLTGQHPGQPPRVFYALRALRLFAH